MDFEGRDRSELNAFEEREAVLVSLSSNFESSGTAAGSLRECDG